VDVNIERNSVVYELTLSRDLGFEINQGYECPVVGKVQAGSKAAALGVMRGDCIMATSATVGGQIWYHDTAESVKSAITTRFVLNSDVIIRFERKIPQIPPDVLPYLQVPYYYFVRLRRPLGLHIKENDKKEVIIERLVDNLSAAKSALIRVGDQIVSMSATWGDKLWDVKSVESFIVAVKMRPDNYLTLKCKRMLPLSHSMERLLQGKSLFNDAQYLYEEEDGRRVYYLNSTKYQVEKEATNNFVSNALPFNDKEDDETSNTEDIVFLEKEGEVRRKDGSQKETIGLSDARKVSASLLHYDTSEYLKFIKSTENLRDFWKYLTRPPQSGQATSNDYLKFHNYITKQTILINIVDRERLDTFAINKLMSKALELNNYQLAIDIFHTAFNYDYYYSAVSTAGRSWKEGDVAGRRKKNLLMSEEDIQQRELYDLLKQPKKIEENDEISWQFVVKLEEKQEKKPRVLVKQTIDLGRLTYSDPNNPSITVRECLAPNNFIIPTIMKAYGRKRELKPIEYLIPWMEQDYNVTADIYSFSSLLYAYAKFQRVERCERLFYEEIPRRNLTINTVTINSFMYLYTKVNRPMDALKLYDIIKENMKKKEMKNKAIVYNEYTFSILIKSLLISNNKRLHSIVFDIIDNLPSIGIYPTIDLYNQLFEYYAMNHDYKKIKEVIKRVMEYNRNLKKAFPHLAGNPLTSIPQPSSSIIADKSSDSSPDLSESDFIQNEREDKTPEAFEPASSSIASSFLPPAPPVMINNPQRVELNLRSYSHIIMGYANSKMPKSALATYLIMRRKGLQPDKYIYHGILKALYWLKDYLSSIQLIEEMIAKKKVMPDMRHYSQAISTCLVASKGELGEELIKFYLYQNDSMVLTSPITGSTRDGRGGMRSNQAMERDRNSNSKNRREVDVLLATLWLHSLLQQSKWHDAMTLFNRMNENRYQKISRMSSAEMMMSDSIYDLVQLPAPSRQTLEILLKYQIQDQRYSEALKTFERVVKMYSYQLAEKKQKGAMPDVVSILAAALGPYATSSLSSYTKTASSDDSNLWMFSFYDDHHKIYSKYSSKSGEQVPRTARESSANHRVSSDSSNSNILDEFSFQHISKIIEDDVVKKQQKGAVGGQEEGEEVMCTINEVPVGDTMQAISENTLTTPERQKQSLSFLLKVIEIVTEYDNVLLSSDLYCDFVKAVLVEQQYSLARRLAFLRRENKIRLRVLDENGVKQTDDFLTDQVKKLDFKLKV